METSELIKQVRKIEIKTRGLSKHIFAGQYHSAFKGRGMAFSEVRGYQYGDDIRSIDWNVTARFNHPYVKVFEEERELTVVLLIDVSGSRNFGSEKKTKKNIMTELSAVLAFSAIQNNDKIGAILFSDKIEKFIPPKKGKQHILRIIRELIFFQPKSKATNITEALGFLTNAIKKRSICFLISDFIDYDETNQSVNYEDALKIAARKHDVVGVKIFDERERSIPSMGLMRVVDAETGKISVVDTFSDHFGTKFDAFFKEMESKQHRVFLKCGVDYTKIRTDQDYVKPLMQIFKRR
jgi:uncharacterized protein (DUF58 family)